MVRFGALLLLCSFSIIGSPSDDFFETRIRPVLAERCYGCHSSKLKTPLGNLRLDVRLSSQAARERLLKAISYTDLDLRMPPSGKLPDAVIADFRRWIELGAPDPREDKPVAPRPAGIDWNEARKFWAFQPVRKPAPNETVDSLLGRKRAERGLNAAAEADKRTLVRRITYDLTGLPPTPGEIAEFLKDSSPGAYPKLVDRLLASPRYGERWARHWLDLVRFAETNGHEFDNDKLDAWQYRDYVIRAFNQDLPYNQFVREQIAGDLLPEKRLSPDGSFWESPLGTSFYWFGEVLNSATDSVKSRADTVDNQLDVMGKAFQGLALGCARCHDHKFDPLPTADYYSLAGVMHSTRMREAVVNSPARDAAIADAKRKIAAALKAGFEIPKQPSTQWRGGDQAFEEFDRFGTWFVSGQAFGERPVNGVASSLGPGTRRLEGSLTSKVFRVPKIWLHVRMAGTKPERTTEASSYTPSKSRVTLVADDFKSAELIPSGKTAGFEWRSARMTLTIGRLSYFEIVDRDPNGFIAVDKIVFSDDEKPPADELDGAPEALSVPSEVAGIDVPPSVWAMQSMDEDPANVRIHIRGSHKNLGEEVPRRFLRVIAGESQTPFPAGSSGRLELAEWIASERNPLTARVLVNRVWQHHFGQGLVRSVDNFGKMGQRPTHPELLDLLAARFVENGWSIKRLHREILLSDAFRMSCTVDAKANETDPANELLHHFPVHRLEAEAIRDAVLAVSGTLDPKMYGPGVVPHVAEFQEAGRGKPRSGPVDGEGRRSIYLQIRRNFIPPMFTAFDYPSPVSTIGSRGASAVPAQALVMMNNEFVFGQAEKWAKRIEDVEPDPAGRVNRMFLEAFGRPPENWESAESLKLATQHGWKDLAHVLFNSPEFIYVR